MAHALVSKLSLLALVAGVALPGVALAQQRSASERAGEEFSFALRGAGEYTFGADLKDVAGSVRIARASSGLGIGYFATEELRLGLDFENEFTWYDFKGANGFIPGTDNPFSQTTSYSLTPNVSYSIDDEWTVIASVLLDWSQEGADPSSDGFTAGGIIGARYTFSKDFALTFGLIGRSRLEESARYLPLIGIEWQIDEKLRFSVRGPGAELTLKLDDEWSVFLDGQFRSREFRLDSDNPLPKGVIRDRRVILGTGVSYRPTKFFDISLRGGVVAWQEFTVDDRRGNEQREINTDPAPFVSLTATLRF